MAAHVNGKNKKPPAKKAAPAKAKEPETPETQIAPPIKLSWKDGVPHGTEWLSAETPKGEIAPARIKMSSRNSDGSYSYFCYRNARAIAVVHALPDAKKACERGTRKEFSQSLIDYVHNHPGELPPFLALTEGERRAVREQYKYAAPAASKVQRAEERGAVTKQDAGDDSDPGTRRLREQLAREGSGAAGRAARAAAGAAPKPRTNALESASGTLQRVKDGNPKKAGTGAHKRWEALFAACGGPLEKYRAAGGNLETLANAIAKGYVKLEEK